MATTLADLAANSQDKLVQGFVNEIITDDYLLGAMTFDDCMTSRIAEFADTGDED